MRDDVEKIVASYLPEDTRAWCNSYKDKRKIVHDGIWGTFELMPHEVAIIDTRLFQRLRYIHQTAGAFWTYPSARHTRFEHSLGVLHQATLLYEKLKRTKSGKNRMNEGLEHNLRCAALLHDTGHGPFSHTSERFFSSLPDINKLLSTDDRFEFSGAGEALSTLIATSQAFKNFIEEINDVFETDIDVSEVGRMITGNFDRNIYKAEIIHGPFDADKLDYMHRDGAFSGLKMFVDIDRLHSSLSIHTHDRATRIAGAVAGTSPLMQILFNKIILTTGMYHHHKVRAVDAMLWAAFDLAYEKKLRLGGARITGTPDFLRLTDDYVLIPELSDEPVSKLIKQIRHRRLWVRALTISRKTIASSAIDADLDVEESPWQEFVNLQKDSIENAKKRKQLARKIWQEAKKPCELYEVCVDIPKRPSVTEANRTWIVPASGGEPLKLKDIVPTGEWVALYELHLWKAYVFCPPHCAQEINRAAKRILKRVQHIEITE